MRTYSAHQHIRLLVAFALFPSSFLLTALPKGGGGGGGGRGGGGGGSNFSGSSSSFGSPSINNVSHRSSYIPGYPYPGYWSWSPHSGPNGRDGCTFHREDTNELAPNAWKESCNNTPLSWWTITLIVFGSIISVCCCTRCCYPKTRINHSKKKSKKLNSLSNNRVTNTNSPRRRRRRSPRNHTINRNESIGVFKHASVNAAARGNAYIVANPRVPFNPQPHDLSTMTNPEAWQFIASNESDDPSLSHVSVMDHIVTFLPIPANNNNNNNNNNNTDQDISLITNLPLPWLPQHFDIKPPAPVLYFEVTITAMSPQTVIAIGLVTVPYPNFRLPGWHDWSLGYHSDDGRIFISDDTNGIAYDKPYRIDDTVGVGVDTTTSTVFFTRNGKRLSNIDSACVPAPNLIIHPCIGADGPCTLLYNFGTSSFLWKEANDMGAMYALELLPPYALEDSVPLISSALDPPSADDHLLPSSHDSNDFTTSPISTTDVPSTTLLPASNPTVSTNP